MKTLLRLSLKPSIPAPTAWYLSELGESRGKQELFTKQSPEKLKALREHVIVESVVSSNRIEGVVVEPSRVGTLVFGQPTFRDRDEEEVSGYRDALRLVHAKGAALPITEQTIMELHRTVMAGFRGSGSCFSCSCTI